MHSDSSSQVLPLRLTVLFPAPRLRALSGYVRLTSVCLSRISGRSREQRGLWRLNLSQRYIVSRQYLSFVGQEVPTICIGGCRTALTTSHRGWEPIGFNWIHPRRKSYGVLPVDDSTRFQLRQSVCAQPLSSQCYFSYDFLVIVIVIVIHFLSF